MTHRSWTVLCAVMLLFGLFGPMLAGGASAQSVAAVRASAQEVAPDEGVANLPHWGDIDSAAWKDPAPKQQNATGGSGAGGDVIGSLPVTAPPADVTSVFHIGPYKCDGVPVSKDVYKNVGESEDHFDGRCANIFKSFTQQFPPDPKSGSH